MENLLVAAAKGEVQELPVAIPGLLDSCMNKCMKYEV